MVPGIEASPDKMLQVCEGGRRGGGGGREKGRGGREGGKEKGERWKYTCKLHSLDRAARICTLGLLVKMAAIICT